MEVLVTYYEISITNLAMLSRINHQRCRQLVKTLEACNYLTTRFEGKRQYVAITPLGRTFAEKLFEIVSADMLEHHNIVV